MKNKISTADMFTPKLITALREGYGVQQLSKDMIAGLTVAIVALPLAMGIAIASGVGPERGLFTAIIAGFIISMLGGSRHQIGGPTAAFIVVVYRTIEHHGYEGLAVATLLAGVMLVVIGALRLGTYIKYVPYPVTLGFTAGIALTIFVSQITDLFGLTTGKLPGDFIPKIEAIAAALPTVNWQTVGLSLASLALIFGLQKFKPNWPRLLIAVVAASLVVPLLGLSVVTIGSKFGGIPNMLPAPSLPALDFALVMKVMPDAFVIALLAGIESLLSAVVADGMTGRRHRSNIELVAQGLANIASPFFGGLPATGAIARTATNIRAGATSPVSGMLHAVFLLVFMLVAAPLAVYVPLAVLSAILAIIAWNMGEAHVVGNFLRYGTTGDRVVLTATFLLTVLVDLTAGIEVGLVLAAFKFMHNMANIVEVETKTPIIEYDRADGKLQPSSGKAVANDTGVLVYRIHGPFFFGAASELTQIMQNISSPIKLMVLDFEGVPLLDSTGATALRSFVKEAAAHSTKVTFTGVRRNVMRSLIRYGIRRPELNFRTAPTIDAALATYNTTLAA